MPLAELADRARLLEEPLIASALLDFAHCDATWDSACLSSTAAYCSSPGLLNLMFSDMLLRCAAQGVLLPGTEAPCCSSRDYSFP